MLVLNILFSLFILSGFSHFTFGNNTTEVDDENESFRLPGNLIPINYYLRLRPIIRKVHNFTRNKSYGNLTLTFECLNETNEIILNALEMNLTSIKIKEEQSGIESVIIKQSLESKFGILRISLKEPLKREGIYEILILFVTKISTDEQSGLYIMKYTEDEKTKYIALTFFAPNYARTVFPCFDEPFYKATFELELYRLPKYKSRSNMHKIQTKKDPVYKDWEIDVYAKSIIMSTYLFSFDISQLETHNGTKTNNSEFSEIEVKIHARKELIDKNGGEYAYKTSHRVLIHMTDYLNMTFPLSKLDSVALPKFPYLAMENWGLIDYMENILIYIKNESSESERWVTTNIIQHEIAHQWFGNLVTCAWWDGIWLNEGFASFFSYKPFDSVISNFEPQHLFINEMHQKGLYYDASPKSHAIASPVYFHGKFGDFYDSIAYQKGSSLLMMMEKFLSEKVFRASLQEYIQKLKFNSATEDDLFDIMGNKSGPVFIPFSNETVTVKEIMKSWTQKQGFPLIYVKNTTSNQITLYQFNFANETSTEMPRWYVPISIASENDSIFNNERTIYWIPKHSNNITIDGINTDKMIIVNPEASGFYRVIYNEYLRKLILDQLERNHTSISPISRSQLIDDFMTIAILKDSYNNDGELNILKYLSKEAELVVWNTVIYYLKIFEDHYSSRPEYIHIMKFFKLRIDLALDKIKMIERQNAKSSIFILEAKLIEWSFKFESNKTLSYLESYYTSINNPEKIPVEIRNIVYCAYVQQDTNGSNWFNLEKRYKAENDTKEKDRLLHGLSCVKNITKINEILPTLFTQNHTENITNLLFYKIKMVEKLLINPYSRNQTAEFLSNNLFLFEMAIETFANQISKFWNTDDERSIVQMIRNNLYNSTSANSVTLKLLDEASIEIDNNIVWRNRTYKKIHNFFEKYI